MWRGWGPGGPAGEEYLHSCVYLFYIYIVALLSLLWRLRLYFLYCGRIVCPRELCWQERSLRNQVADAQGAQQRAEGERVPLIANFE